MSKFYNGDLQTILNRRKEEGIPLLDMHIKADEVDEDSWAIDVYDLDLYECETALYSSEYEFRQDAKRLRKIAKKKELKYHRLEACIDAQSHLLSAEDDHSLGLMAMNLRAEEHRLSRSFVPFRVYETSHGFLIFICGDVDEVKEECEKQRYHLSQTFWFLYRKAYKMGCMILNFDVDA
jgi:hypothetical protein